MKLKRPSAVFRALLNDDTRLFPPQKCCKDTSLILTATQNYLSLRAKKFSQLQKKKFKRVWEKQLTCSYLFEVLLHMLKTLPTCPAFISPLCKTSPAQSQWIGTTARPTFIYLQREILMARADFVAQTRLCCYLCYQVFTLQTGRIYPNF